MGFYNIENRKKCLFFLVFKDNNNNKFRVIMFNIKWIVRFKKCDRVFV